VKRLNKNKIKIVSRFKKKPSYFAFFSTDRLVEGKRENRRMYGSQIFNGSPDK
jgi:hypothetical protein